MTPARISIERIERIFVDALQSESFTRHGARRGTWDVSHDCDSPVPVVLHSRATERLANLGDRGVIPRPGIELIMLTACRKCRVCMAKRSKLWTFRAMNEIDASSRTWFGTLTVEPAKHYWIDELAATRKRDFWQLTESKKFETRVRVLGEQVTLYLKRLRKEARTKFRYLLVSEMHDSPNTSPLMRGRPHVHLFMHELWGQPALKKRTLEAQWPLGFSSWKIADRRAAWYISKYLTKANDARIRASLEYGNSDEGP